MKFAFNLALRILKPQKGTKKYDLIGTILAIALSLLPLIVVLEVANGMIEGITRRLIEVGTYHLQVSSGFRDISEDQLEATLTKIKNISGINTAIIERQGFGVPESLLVFSCLRGGTDKQACYGCFFTYLDSVA